MNAESRQGFSAVRQVGDYSVRLSDALDDPEWDDFLEPKWSWSICPQTSGWGRARASIGWRPVRLIVSEAGQIVAGAQMMTRPLPVGGNIGFVCRGPIVDRDRPDLAGLVFDELMAMGRTLEVQYLVVQPPRTGEWMCRQLTALGFGSGAFDIDVTATVRIDLEAGLDELFAGVSQTYREHVRLAERSGVTVRRGSGPDLRVFSGLKDAHSARFAYTPREAGYYEELWRALRTRGHIELFIAEVRGTPVSALLVVPFGADCYHMERVWSGEHCDLRPNELLEWEVIKWARSEGHRFSDLDGIDQPIAKAMLSGGKLPDDPRHGESCHKLQFGGQVVIDPPSFHYLYNPLLRSAYRCIPNGVLRSKWMGGLVMRLRPAGA